MTDIQAITDAGAAIEAPLTYTTEAAEKLVYQITETSEDEDNPIVRERYAVHHMPVHDVRPFAENLTLDECLSQDGLFQANQPGVGADDDNDALDDGCFPQVPTVSDWGLVVLALLLIIAAKLRLVAAKRRVRA